MFVYTITKHSSALYMGMAKVLPIINVLGYDGQNSSFSPSSHSDNIVIVNNRKHAVFSTKCCFIWKLLLIVYTGIMCDWY